MAFKLFEFQEQFDKKISQFEKVGQSIGQHFYSTGKSEN